MDAGNRTDSWQVFYVPDVGMVRAAGEFNTVEWSRVPAATRAAYAGVAAGLQPFEVPHLSAVRVGVRAVAANPDSYLRLYSVGRRFYGVVQGARWIRITLRSLVPSPWTDGLSVLSYSSNRRLLRRDGATLRISKRLCDQLSRGAALV